MIHAHDNVYHDYVWVREDYLTRATAPLLMVYSSHLHFYIYFFDPPI